MSNINPKAPSTAAPNKPGAQPPAATVKLTRSSRRRVKRANFFTEKLAVNRYAARDASWMPRLTTEEAMEWLSRQPWIKFLVFKAALSAEVLIAEPEGMCRGRWTKAADSDKPQKEPAPSPADQQGGAP